jgi:hypothetical protein
MARPRSVSKSTPAGPSPDKLEPGSLRSISVQQAQLVGIGLALVALLPIVLGYWGAALIFVSMVAFLLAIA